jgi:hypothetical protein
MKFRGKLKDAEAGHRKGTKAADERLASEQILAVLPRVKLLYRGVFVLDLVVQSALRIGPGKVHSEDDNAVR